jgi:hypothetical protein
MMKRFWLAMALMGAFVAGVGAQRAVTGVSLQGNVIDANTIDEDVAYWEVRSGGGESIVIAGRKELPMISWLRRAKGRAVVVTIDPVP